MEKQMTSDKQVTLEMILGIFEKIRTIAEKVLPKGLDTQTEAEYLLRAAIPDTYEWFESKFYLVPKTSKTASELVDALKEWSEYIIKKAHEHIAMCKEIVSTR